MIEYKKYDHNETYKILVPMCCQEKLQCIFNQKQDGLTVANINVFKLTYLQSTNYCLQYAVQFDIFSRLLVNKSHSSSGLEVDRSSLVINRRKYDIFMCNLCVVIRQIIPQQNDLAYEYNGGGNKDDRGNHITVKPHFTNHYGGVVDVLNVRADIKSFQNISVLCHKINPLSASYQGLYAVDFMQSKEQNFWQFVDL